MKTKQQETREWAMEMARKKFNAETGMRLTNCCAADSTYMDDGIGGEDLCCKACYYEVEVGEGDGNEYKKGYGI
jgi:hypothetical protein